MCLSTVSGKQLDSWTNYSLKDIDLPVFSGHMQVIRSHSCLCEINKHGLQLPLLGGCINKFCRGHNKTKMDAEI